MIIGYIIAGILMSIFIPNILESGGAFQSFSNIGISFLLFMVGIELNPTIIKDLGKWSLIAGSLQVFVTSVIGFFLAQAVGCDQITSLYLGVGFAFSSTIVVLKLLSDKEETESTFGRLSIGILIVQDVLVLLLFLAIASFQQFQTQEIGVVLGTLIIKMILLGGGVYLVSKYLIPKISQKIAESQEFLFLFAIGRCMILGTIFYYAGFGLEFGTLIAGMALSNSPFKYEISSKIKSLRDFFIVMYFVLLWSQVHFSHNIHILRIIVFSLCIIIIKPLISMVIFGIMGHTKKNNFLAGLSLGQISEFSFILIAMGIVNGSIKDPNILSTITIVGLISIAISSYGILYGNKIYQYLKPLLAYIPWSRNKNYQKINEQEYDVMLFGYGKFGNNLYETLYKRYKNILIIDEHPAIISHLKSKDIDCMYGDVGDNEFLDELDVKGTKMIISTVKKFDENMVLLETIKKDHPHIIVILLSNHVQEAIKLYEQGADYVILPHYIWAYHTSLMLEEYGFDIDKFLINKKSQVHDLKNRHKDLMIEALQGKM